MQQNAMLLCGEPTLPALPGWLGPSSIHSCSHPQSYSLHGLLPPATHIHGFNLPEPQLLGVNILPASLGLKPWSAPSAWVLSCCLGLASLSAAQVQSELPQVVSSFMLTSTNQQIRMSS